MPATINEQTADAVNMVNVKNLGDMGPLVAGLSSQNAVANQQAVQGMLNASLQAHLGTMNALGARTSRFILDTSAEEAVAFSKQIASNVQDQLSQFGAILSSTQQNAKIANTTPPETGIAQQLANLSASMTAVLAFLQAQANGPSPQPTGK